MTTRAPEEEARAAAGAAPEEGARRAARMRGCVRGAGGAGGQQVAGHSQAAMKVTMPVMSSAVLYFSLIAETRDQKKIVEAIMHASEKLSTLYTSGTGLVGRGGRAAHAPGWSAVGRCEAGLAECAAAGAGEAGGSAGL